MTASWPAITAALLLAGCAGSSPTQGPTRPLPLAELPALVNYWQAGDEAPIDTGSLGGGVRGAPLRWDSRAAERRTESGGAAFAAPDGSFEVALLPHMRQGTEQSVDEAYQVSFDFTDKPAYCRYEIGRVDAAGRQIDNAALMSLVVSSYRAQMLELFYVGVSEVEGETIHVVLAGFDGLIRAEAAHAIGDRVFHSVCAVDRNWLRGQGSADALSSMLGDLVVTATAVRFPTLPLGPSIRI